MIKINIKNWKLRNKIILHLLVIGMLAASLLTFLYIKTQQNVIHSMSRQKAKIIGSMIENSISSSMKNGENEEVQSILKKIAHSNDIKGIRILNLQGKILRSSYPDEIGTRVDSGTQDRMSDVLSSDFQAKNNWENMIYIKSNSTIQGFRVIENGKDCFSCHSSEKKINGILEVNIDYAPAVALFKNTQIKGIIIAIFSLIILAVIIIRLFDKLINRPIFHLKEKMKKVQGGDLDIQISGAKDDEIGSLTNSFNEMIRKLKEANHKIEDLYNKQMERAEHLASIGELAAGLAHEIKNPIAGMRGALEIINQQTHASDPKKEIFIEMLLQIEKINNVVHDLLSYAKPKEMSRSLYDPNQCIAESIKLAKPQLNGKDIRFQIHSLKSGDLALIDADKVQEVLLNLMLNSIHAINNKGIISIKLKKINNKELEIAFSDNGQGIKKEHLSQIFNPFFTTKSRGTGLGLSICRKIIEAHNGSIRVHSIEKKGTSFIIRLPALQQRIDHA